MSRLFAIPVVLLTIIGYGLVKGAETPLKAVAETPLTKQPAKPPTSNRFDEYIEKKLRAEKADTEDLSPKLGSALSKGDKIEGQWDSHYWHDGPHLTIRKTEGNKYRVTLYARGDLSSFQLERIATFKAGVLTFDKPVMEYLPVKPYIRFYLLKTPHGPRFASQALVRRDVIGKKRVDWDYLEKTYLLNKKVKQETKK